MGVSGNKTKGYDFECDLDVFGNTPPKNAAENHPMCGFTSSGHEKKTDAEVRGDQHLAEHATGEAMAEIGQLSQGGED